MVPDPGGAVLALSAPAARCGGAGCSTRRALAIAFVAFVARLHWAHGYADRRYGEMWPQVLATSVGYGVFLAVLLVAIYVRRAGCGGVRRGAAIQLACAFCAARRRALVNPLSRR